MRLQPIMARAAALGVAGILLLTSTVQAAEGYGWFSSGGFAAAYRALAPEFEQQSRNTLVTEWGPSMGDTKDAVPARLARKEPIDVLIMVGYALDKLVEQGAVIPGQPGQAGAIRHRRGGAGGRAAAGTSAPSTRCGARAAGGEDPSRIPTAPAGSTSQNKMLTRDGHRRSEMKGKAHMIPAEAGRRRGGAGQRGDRFPAGQRAATRDQGHRPASVHCRPRRAANDGVLGRRWTLPRASTRRPPGR